MDTPATTPPDPRRYDADPGLAAQARPGTVTQLAEALAERYVLERPIGRGGMATVYLAVDRRHDRRVAVKVLHPEFAASIGAERFLREIRLAATLQHPHVLGLYDSGGAAGLLYYVMPFVEGESLRDRLVRGEQLPIGEALQIAGEVANALAYAHERGVVHRDVKPENILLSNGHAVVADFGIARAVSSAGSEKLTETGMALGTPQYMSPEQGTGGTVGPASDVYALGCVLYEMLVGEPPFTGPNARAVIARHAMAEVPSVRLVRPSVTPDVEHLVARALAKSPADRWPTAAELERAIRLAAATATTAPPPGMPVGARGAGVPPGVGARRAHGRRGTVAAMLGAAAALVGAGALVVQQAGWVGGGARSVAGAASPLDARRIAVMYFEHPAGDSALAPVADGLTESLARALGDVPGLAVVSAAGTLPFRDGAATLDSAARALSVATLVTGRVEPEAGGRVRVTLTLRDASGAAFGDTTLVRPAADLLRLRDDVIDEAATLVRRRLGDEVALRASRLGTRDAEAWALAQRGLREAKRAAAAAQAGDDAAVARADSLADAYLAQAEARDPRWGVPPVERARLAYAQSRRRGPDPAYAEPLIARGLAHADRALARDSTADALETRGTLRYWQWLLRLGSPDPRAREAGLRAAEADLERATRLRPAQAGAWAALSHLYIMAPEKGELDAKLAATRAYEADPYLTDANRLLWRLASLSYDLAQFPDARRYCAELGRRFPGDPEHARCSLVLLSVPDAPAASPAEAWALAARRERLAPPPQRASVGLESRVFVAAALAHAGLRDSARRVLERTLADPAGASNDLIPTAGAWVYLLLGDTDRAFATLKRTVDMLGAMGRTQGLAFDQWWWRDVKDDPRWRALHGI